MRTRQPEKALSAAFVRSVEKPGKYFDGHGLFLRVDKNGGRCWVQRIVVRGKRTELGLGAASLVSLAEARDRALENRKLARSGGNPLQARREAKEVPTFTEAARKVHELHRPTWRNPKHAAQFVTTLETYAFPYFGKLRVSEVTKADVMSALTPIWTSKPETARRVRQRIRVVMSWAVSQGWREDNPAEVLALPKMDTSRVKHRKALPYTEVASAIEAVRNSGAAPSTRLALEFLVLTAARAGEVRLARWSEIDLDAGEWLVPIERMKAKRPHRVPLSKRALEILIEAKALDDGSGLVFPGARQGRPLSENTFVKLLRGLGFEVDAHGFRTSFKTWAQERTNLANEVSEMALAHIIKNKAEAAYARSNLLEKRRLMMESWAAFLTAEPGKIVRIGT